MRALVIADGRATVRDEVALPVAAAGEVRVAVRAAGICATDLALRRGYMRFAGVPGHEFVGVALDGPLAGQRVVGEINAGCGRCERCRTGLARHCAARSVLGLLGRSGAFAEQLVLPAANLHPLPPEVSDDAALFTEPLAAAFAIAEQVDLTAVPDALVVGDGKLGLLCAHALALHGVAVLVAGRHPERAALLPAGALHLGEPLQDATTPFAFAAHQRFPLVVEASGRADAVARAIGRVAPRGTLILKTTTEAPTTLPLAALVVDEITLRGSRCGDFAPALAALAEGFLDPRPLIVARYPLAQADRALDHAARPGTLKVVIDVAAPPQAAAPERTA